MKTVNLFAGFIAGVLITVIFVITLQPVNKNYRCAHVYNPNNLPTSWKQAGNIRFDSGIWFKGVEPIGFSFTKESDICVWK